MNNYLGRIFFIAALPLGLAAQEQLRVTIEMDQTSFVVGEPAFIGIHVANIGQTNIETPPPSIRTGTLSIMLTEADGRTLEYRGPISYSLPGTKITIPAGGEDFVFEELTSGFGTLFSASSLSRFIDAGDYLIQVSFVYNGVKLSNELKISIKDPSGSEAQAYQRFREALTGVSRATMAPDQAASQLEAIPPKSAYAPLALYVAYNWYKDYLWNDAKAEAIEARMLETYPASGKARPFLLKKADQMNPQQRAEFLDDLSTRTRGSLVSKAVRESFEKNK